MKFPNAYEGIKKLILAEAFQIISAGLTIIIAILGVSALTGAVAGSDAAAAGAIASGIGMVLLSIGVLVLGILAVIFQLIGLKKASNDEPQYFKSAFILAIIVLVASVLYGFLASIPGLATFGGVIGAVLNVATIAVFVCTITGISTLARQLGREDMVSMGNVILIVEIIQLVLATVAKFTNGILAIIAAIVSLIGYIIYLVYLTKSKQMLEN